MRSAMSVKCLHVSFIKLDAQWIFLSQVETVFNRRKRKTYQQRSTVCYWQKVKNISHFWKVLKAKTIFSAHITVRVGVTHTHHNEWRQQRGQDSKKNSIRGRPWSPTTGEIALEMMYSLHVIIRKCCKQFQELSGSSRHVIPPPQVNTSGLKQHTWPWRAGPSGHNSHTQTVMCASLLPCGWNATPYHSVFNGGNSWQ